MKEAGGSKEEVLLLKQEVKKLFSASHLSEGEEAMELLYNKEGIVEDLLCSFFTNDQKLRGFDLADSE